MRDYVSLIQECLHILEDTTMYVPAALAKAAYAPGDMLRRKVSRGSCSTVHAIGVMRCSDSALGSLWWCAYVLAVVGAVWLACAGISMAATCEVCPVFAGLLSPSTLRQRS